MAASRSAGCAAEFVNIGRYVVVTSKSVPVETGPTILVATALFCMLIAGGTCNYAFTQDYYVCDTGGEERTTVSTVIPTGVTTMTSETIG